MNQLRKILKRRLSGAKRTGILGVGSEFRGDDIAGLLVAEQVSKRRRTSRKMRRNIKVFFGETAPENLTGEIKKFKPSHIIIIDSAEMGKKPGSVRVLTNEDVGGVSFSTHKMPIIVMMDYLLRSFECEFIMIGIQPKSVDFGSPVSRAVERSARNISRTIKEIIAK